MQRRLTPRPHPARHALQSTTSDRSHTVGFNCRLTCGGSPFGIEPAPPRNASIHASETECSPSSLTLCLAKRVTRSVARRSHRRRYIDGSNVILSPRLTQPPPGPKKSHCACAVPVARNSSTIAKAKLHISSSPLRLRRDCRSYRAHPARHALQSQPTA